MKKLLYLCCFWCTTLFAQETIYPLSVKNYSSDYYYQQNELWNKQIKHDSTNANAWLQSYLSLHYVLVTDKAQNYGITQKMLDALVNQAENHVPNSFEWNYIKFVNSGNNPAYLKYLEKAFAIDSARTETYDKLLTQYELRGDKDKTSYFAKKMYDSQLISPNWYYWNYNNLIGLDKNAIVFTQGDNDTYPAWVLQKVQKVRPDVLVLNVSMLNNADYAKRIFQKIPVPIKETQNSTDALNYVMEQVNDRSIYISSSVNPSLYNSYQEKLYPVGLPLKYSAQNFDNIQQIQSNYENTFLLDYLKTDLFANTRDELSYYADLNYIPSFVLLENYYTSNKQTKQANELKNMVYNIAKRADAENELESYYNNDKADILLNNLPFKHLEKSLMQAQNGLYFNAFETTNEWYKYFLDYLYENKEFDLLKRYSPADVDWRSYLTKDEQSLPDEVIFERGLPTEANLPIQNVSYEAAEAFCRWLSKQYNAWDYSKKKFKQVTFRLPTKNEWTTAAAGGTDAKNYPWDYSTGRSEKENQYITGTSQNIKGCYLGNFYCSNEKPCEDCPAASMNPNSIDGGFFTVRVDAYWPNKYGLYNMVGNVAEMVQGKKAMGGSWHDVPEKCTFNNDQDASIPQPWIGFRIVAETK